MADEQKPETSTSRLKEILKAAREGAQDTAPEALDSPLIKDLLAIGLARPHELSPTQIRKLCGSVMAHVQLG